MHALKILFAVHGYKPAWRVGGPIISVSSMAQRLVRRGHEVTVFTTNSNLDRDLDVDTERYHDVDGVRVRYFARSQRLRRFLPSVSYFSKSMGFLYCPQMRAELERVVPRMDVVHTHLPFVYPTYAAARAALRHRKPLFYNQRGVFDPERLKFRSLKKLAYIRFAELPVLRRATSLLALTHAEVDSYRRLGVTTPCRVVPNGIEPADYAQSASAEVLARIARPGETVVLFLGRVHPIKGADVLLEAFLQVAGRLPRARLVIAGPDEFGLEIQFRQRAAAAGIGERVQFSGMVQGEAKRALLARADLFVLPSAGEGFSIAVLEALASACAVVLSPGCHFPEVEEAGAGRIVPPTAAALTEALASLLAEPQRLAQMGERGRALVQARYSWDTACDALLEAYDEGIARAVAGSS